MKNQLCKFRLLIPLFILGIVALVALAVYGLWNGVLTDVLPVKAITYWQAVGILILSKILFGGFPGRGRGHFGPPGRRMMKHWESLSPEQREKLREKMRHRCGDAHLPPWYDSKSPDRSENPSNAAASSPGTVAPPAP